MQRAIKAIIRPGTIRRAGIALLALGLVAGAGPGLAQTPAPEAASTVSVPGYTGIDIFEMPALALQEAGIVSVARRGDLAGARAALGQLASRYPEAGRFQLLQAVLAAAAGDDEAAITALLEADRLGATGLGAALAAQPLTRLAADPRLTGVTDRPAPAPPDPRLVQGGTALVTADGVGWDPAAGRITARFDFPPVLRTHRFADKPNPKSPIAQLQRLVARGLAAGNVGDLYDNRDDGHSRLRKGQRTQLSHIDYGPAARAAGLHYGLNTGILFNRPTFGNSSTALTGHLGRSQARHGLTAPGGVQRLWQLYANNHIYVFPEAGDHEPRRGDLFPANTPYFLVSQGMSGSDQPLLQAVQAILAAFPPKVKERLIEEKLIAPMIQQIFRRGLAGAPDYLSPEAHPVVVRGEDIDLAAMIAHAQSLRPETIPPMVTLRVLRETPPGPGIFADGLNEILFDTPGAVARVWRSALGTRQYALEAAAEDPNGQPLTFHWRVIRGDADRIGIEPLDETGQRVQLTLPWHDPGPIPGRPDITGSRVDIAVFAHNGTEYSAPAFFSMLYPAHEARVHDGAARVLSVDFAPGNGAYTDWLLWPQRNWRDAFLHDAERQVIGWTRHRPGGRVTRFTAHGLEILETDTEDRVTLAARVSYPLTRAENGGFIVTETREQDLFRYEYEGPSDRIGRPVPVAAAE